MKSRCDRPKDQAYSRYGGAGITYEPRWAEYGNFLADMGERPPGRTLDRIDNSKGYSRDNCQWATESEQNLNRDRWKLSAETKQIVTVLYLEGVGVRCMSRQLGLPRTALNRFIQKELLANELQTNRPEDGE